MCTGTGDLIDHHAFICIRDWDHECQHRLRIRIATGDMVCSSALDNEPKMRKNIDSVSKPTNERGEKIEKCSGSAVKHRVRLGEDRGCDLIRKITDHRRRRLGEWSVKAISCLLLDNWVVAPT